MSNTLTIAALGRTIYGDASALPDGTGMVVKQRGLQGWEGLPAGRRESIARATSHGEHDTPVYLPARVVTVDVWLLAKSEYDLGKLSNRFTSWGATGESFDLAVDLQESVQWARVRRILATAEDSGQRRPGGFYSSGQIQFLASNPRKFGDMTVFPASGTATSVQVSHRGTFPAHVIVEIPSAPSSYTVTTPAGTFSVTGATSGGTHRIDTATGRVTRNGTWMPDVGSGALWAVPEDTVWTHTLSAPGRVLIADTFV